MGGSQVAPTDEDGRVEAEVETVGFDREPAPASDNFKSKRAAHYNEYQLMKAMQAKMQEEEDEEEEEEEDD